MSKQNIEDRDWWRDVGSIIGAKLYGWNYRNSASFINPNIEVNGKVGAILIEQRNKIERLLHDF